jgi:hypothetical protein
MRSVMIWTPHLLILRVVKSRGMRWEGYVARLGEGRVVYRGLVGKPEGDNLIDSDVDGKFNIKFELQEVGCGGMDWIELAND